MASYQHRNVIVTARVFAAKQGMVKLRLALRSLARVHSEMMDVGEAAWFGSDKLRRLFNITEEPGALPPKRLC